MNRVSFLLDWTDKDAMNRVSTNKESVAQATLSV